MDPVSGEIIAETTTTLTTDDGEVLDHLLTITPKSVKRVLGDGVYDGLKYRERIKRHGTKALASPPRHVRIRRRDPDRDEAMKLTRGFGGDTNARSLWGKLTGYSRRALVENTFSRMKKMFGAGLFSKESNRQVVENYYRCLLLNRMNTRVC
jgi:IS5 family transposase